MAKKTEAAGTEGFPAKIDPAAQYVVQLLKPVPFAGMVLSPAEKHEMSGETLQAFLDGEHGDSIYGAEHA